MLSVLNLDKVEFRGLGTSAAGRFNVWRLKAEAVFYRVRFGSSASCRPSPTNEKPSIVSATRIVGNNARW